MTNCKECFKKFEPNYKNKIYCSDKCRPPYLLKNREIKNYLNRLKNSKLTIEEKRRRRYGGDVKIPLTPLQKQRASEIVLRYYYANKKIVNEKVRLRNKIRLSTDPNYKLKMYMRNRLNSALKVTNLSKNNQTFKYIGCTPEELKHHLQSKFTDGMSWENYGEWHVDHVIPISSFDLSKEEEIYKAMNYKNLQPLWAMDNIRKSNKITLV